MLLIPAWVWRGGPAYRALCVGVPAGVLAGALVFAESGMLLGALVAFVVIGVFNGIMMARRIGRGWPAASVLSPDERVAVCSAARRGHRIEEARLAPAAIEYVSGLRNGRVHVRRWEWLAWLGAGAMLCLAVSDSFFATPRVAAVSWLIVVLLAVEISWWPRVRDRLLANAERTGQSAAQLLGQQVDEV